MKKALTLYENFKDYTEEQVNEALKKLTEKDILLLKQKYGDDYKHPRPVSKDKKSKIVYILKIIRRCLEDPDYTPRRQNRPDNQLSLVNQEFTNNLLEPNAETLLSLMSLEEVIIYTNRLEALAIQLNINAKEILKLKKKVLEMYKQSVGTTLKSIGANITEPSSEIPVEVPPTEEKIKQNA